MRAVFYHADAHMAWGGKPPKGGYKKLADRFVGQCHAKGMQVTHLTCDGHPVWADEGFSYPLDPKNVVANREEAFTSFLETAPDDWYWFVEPDFQILLDLPQPKDCDAVFLYRPGDDVPMCPAFRMATPKALPIFQALREAMRADHRKDWHGDSAAFTKVWGEMGKPQLGRHEWLGVGYEMWKYANFVKPGGFTRNHFGTGKFV